MKKFTTFKDFAETYQKAALLTHGIFKKLK